jgi:hypothetical protein
MIRDVHLGSGSWFITHPGSGGLKGTGSQIPDTDPRHCRNLREWNRIPFSLWFFVGKSCQKSNILLIFSPNAFFNWSWKFKYSLSPVAKGSFFCYTNISHICFWKLIPCPDNQKKERIVEAWTVKYSLMLRRWKEELTEKVLWVNKS